MVINFRRTKVEAVHSLAPVCFADLVTCWNVVLWRRALDDYVMQQRVDVPPWLRTFMRRCHFRLFGQQGLHSMATEEA